jgi:hypothetical protein
MRGGLVHAAGDLETLTSHLRLVDRDRGFLECLRTHTLGKREQLTWEQGVHDLERIYAGLVKPRADE